MSNKNKFAPRAVTPSAPVAAPVSDAPAPVSDAPAPVTAVEPVTPPAVEPAAVPVTPAPRARKATGPKQPDYHVRPGKSMTTRRGIVATERDAVVYSEVKPENVIGGAATLDGLVRSGHVGRG